MQPLCCGAPSRLENLASGLGGQSRVAFPSHDRQPCGKSQQTWESGLIQLLVLQMGKLTPLAEILLASGSCQSYLSGRGSAGSQTKPCVRAEAMLAHPLLAPQHPAECLALRRIHKHLWEESVDVISTPLPPHQPGSLALLLRLDSFNLQRHPSAPPPGQQFSQGHG